MQTMRQLKFLLKKRVFFMTLVGNGIFWVALLC